MYDAIKLSTGLCIGIGSIFLYKEMMHTLIDLKHEKFALILLIISC